MPSALHREGLALAPDWGCQFTGTKLLWRAGVVSSAAEFTQSGGKSSIYHHSSGSAGAAGVSICMRTCPKWV